MIISKDLQWLDEYIEASSHLVPNLSKLKRITALYSRPNTGHLFYGNLFEYKKGGYRMNIYINYFVNNKKKYFSTIDILNVLAHELSHLQHWHHSPEHKILESTLSIVFMGKLKSSGYISEEHELETIK